MKKAVSILSLALVITLGLITDAVAGTPVGQEKKAEAVQVYYFHLNRRCATCQTVEKVALQSVNELYPDAVEEGKLIFKSLSYEDKANKELIRKLKVSGQSLLIVSGKDRHDITDKGFLYAVREPEKLKAEMKTLLDNYIR